jgi:hypothetical protein
MMLWNQTQPSVTAGFLHPVQFSVSWQDVTHGMSVAHNMDVTVCPTFETSRSDVEQLYYRVCAYALLNAMPSVGLKDACERLAEIHNYFVAPQHVRLFAVPSKVARASVSPVRKQKAFQVSSDE